MEPLKKVYQIFFILFLTIASCSSTQELVSQPKVIINIEKNLRYGTVPEFYQDSSSDRRLDIYRPEDIKGKLPVVLFVHGGGFAAGDKSRKKELFTKISSAGYAVISMNYRLYLKHNKISGANNSSNKGKEKFYPGKQMAVSIASEDAISVLKWIIENAEQYNLDISKVAISGGSAGAMTALYTTYASNQQVLPIKAVVNLWGALENAQLIKKDSPPVLSYHGDNDFTVSVDYSYALHKQMEKMGNRNSILNVMEGKGHAQYNYIISEKVDEILRFLSKNM